MTTEAIDLPKDIKVISTFATVKLVGESWGRRLYLVRDKKVNSGQTEGDRRSLFILSDNDGADYIDIYNGSVISKTKWSSIFRSISDKGFNGDFAKTRIMACVVCGIDPPVKHGATWYYLKSITGPEVNGLVTLLNHVSVEVSPQQREIKMSVGTSNYIGRIKTMPSSPGCFPQIDWREEFSS